MYSHTILDTVFLASVTVIWFMVGYQALLFFLGHQFYQRTRRSGMFVPSVPDSELPAVSVLVPCHNEELVISGTLQALFALEYPVALVEILIVDDGSTDRTAENIQRFAQDPRLTVLRVPPEIAARGKAGALNYGLTAAKHPIVAIYDADNRPEPGALRPLVEALVRDPSLGAAIGIFRCLNRRRNLLTRFLNIEGIAYQWIVQAGRWALMRFTALPGTNYVIRRPLLHSLGGWDQSALTEDAELTLRIYEAGYSIAFVPTSVTWEQEPENLSTWLRQRHRWVRGNNHVFKKHASKLLRIRPRSIGVELLYSLSLFYGFFVAVVASDLFFVLGAAGLVHLEVAGPYALVWLFAFLAFCLELAIALAYENEGESWADNLLIIAMYFTYCQLWIPVVAWAFYDDFITRRPAKWAKTRRFEAVHPELTPILTRTGTPAEKQSPAGDESSRVARAYGKRISCLLPLAMGITLGWPQEVCRAATLDWPDPAVSGCVRIRPCSGCQSFHAEQENR
jgi:cellulose synthase/poly-beta-1,6-N-acetylglucosamine synthase-like glycosyltransferase